MNEWATADSQGKETEWEPGVLPLSSVLETVTSRQRMMDKHESFC